MAAIFFKMATIRYSCIEKKLFVQLKFAHLTRKKDKTINNDERKY